MSCLYRATAIDGLIPFDSAVIAIVFTILNGERLLHPTFIISPQTVSGISVCRANSFASFSLGSVAYEPSSTEINAV